MPGDELLRIADGVWWLRYSCGIGLAFAGIYALALANKLFTSSLWRAFALLSPAGAVPPWHWFVWQACCACASVAVFVGAAGMLSPYLRPEPPPFLVEQFVRDHATVMLTVAILIVVLHQLRVRSATIDNRDIWGSRSRAFLATLLKITALLVTPLLFALANQLFIG